MSEGLKPSQDQWLADQQRRAEKIIPQDTVKRIEETLRQFIPTETVKSYHEVLTADGTLVQFVFKRAENASRETMFCNGEPILTPEMYSPDNLTEINELHVSPDGTYILLQTMYAGDESTSKIEIFDVETKTILPDRVSHTAQAQILWHPSGKGFYYTRSEKSPFVRPVHYHVVDLARGADSYQEDPVVYQVEKEDENIDWTSGFVLGNDGEHISFFIHDLLTGSRRSYLFRLPENPTDPWNDIQRPVFEALDRSQKGEKADPYAFGDHVYIVTNLQAENGKVMRVPVSAGDYSDRTNWETIMPEIPNEFIEDLTIIDGRLFLQKKDRYGSNHVYEWNSTEERFTLLPLLPDSSIKIQSAREPGKVIYSAESFLQQPAIWKTNFETGETTMIEGPETPEFLNTITVERRLFSWDSPDSHFTELPMYVIRPKDRNQRTNRTIVWGYGGFGVNWGAVYSRKAAYWASEGNTYVFLPALPGDGTLGEGLHRLGVGAQKENTIRAYEAALQYLIDNDIAEMDSIVPWGASNGGVTVLGVALKQTEQYKVRAVVVEVPVTNIEAGLANEATSWWGAEYEGADYQTTSPYHLLQEGETYPGILALVGANDKNVDPKIHSFPFMRLLQQCDPKGKHVLVVQGSAGHGQSDLNEKIKQEATAFAYLT